MASLRRDAALRQIDRLFGEGTLAGSSDARLLERYLSDRDELAFEALVRRHGPMVLGVCRRLLNDPNDADDAFQAAFLLLARRRISIREEECIGGWLHRVAWRIAVQVRSDAARRRERERQAAVYVGEPMTSNAGHDDTVAMIHQEIDRLPDRYRRPVVLCYLEEMTYRQAADQLRWSEATTRGRLARARDLLRARLTRRGVALGGAGLGLAVGASPSMAATVPAALLQVTVRAARHLALGESAAVSTTTVALVKRAARAMVLARLKAVAATAVVVAALAGLGTGLAAMGIGDDQPRSAGPDRVVRADQEKGAEGPTITVRGRVLAPDGKPAAGAGVYTIASRPDGDPAEPVLRAKAGADGAYRFAIPGQEFNAVVEAWPWSALTLLAVADGLGPDWIHLKEPPDEPVNLRLVDDSVPISGRILDLQGHPVAGAKVTRSAIMAEGAQGIDPYLELLRNDPFRASNHNFAKSYGDGVRLPGRPASVTTDADGRFRLTGIGRDRIIDLAVEGPTIHSATITAMTRNAAAVSTPRDAFSAKTVYGATFEHLVPPGRALTGVVRDKRTGRPLAGIHVGGMGTNARATTDAEGRYTLPGFPKGRSYGLMVVAGAKPPYFATCRDVPDTAGLDPLQADVDCVPGILLRLKLIDKETGKPAAGADVAYWPIFPNGHVREVSGFAPIHGSGPYSDGIQQADGTYLLGVLPGPGAVMVRTAEGRYRPACVDPRAFFDAKGTTKADQQMIYGDRNSLSIASGEGLGSMPQSQFSAIVLVNPPDDSGPLAAEAVLERDPGAGPGARARQRAPGRRDRRGRGRGRHEDAGCDDRLGAQPDASEAILVPPRRPQARRLPAGPGRRVRALYRPPATLGHDHRPPGRRAGAAEAECRAGEHRLAGCHERSGPRHPVPHQNRRRGAVPRRGPDPRPVLHRQRGGR